MNVNNIILVRGCSMACINNLFNKGDGSADKGDVKLTILM